MGLAHTHNNFVCDDTMAMHCFCLHSMLVIMLITKQIAEILKHVIQNSKTKLYTVPATKHLFFFATVVCCINAVGSDDDWSHHMTHISPNKV